MIDEAGEGGAGGCFTVEEVVESCRDPKQFLTVPVAGATTPRRGGRVTPGMPGGPEQTHQLFLCLWDEVWERRPQFLQDGADGLQRGERVSLTLPSSGGSQSRKRALGRGMMLHGDLYHM